MLAFFAASSIAFLAARRSFRSACLAAFPVRALAPTRFFIASCLAFVPRFSFSAFEFLLSRAFKVFFFLFCHPGATMTRARSPRTRPSRAFLASRRRARRSRTARRARVRRERRRAPAAGGVFFTYCMICYDQYYRRSSAAHARTTSLMRWTLSSTQALIVPKCNVETPTAAPAKTAYRTPTACETSFVAPVRTAMLCNAEHDSH